MAFALVVLSRQILYSQDDILNDTRIGRHVQQLCCRRQCRQHHLSHLIQCLINDAGPMPRYSRTWPRQAIPSVHRSPMLCVNIAVIALQLESLLIVSEGWRSSWCSGWILYNYIVILAGIWFVQAPAFKYFCRHREVEFVALRP